MENNSTQVVLKNVLTRGSMLGRQLKAIENRISGRDNSFLPFICNKNGKISGSKLKSTINELLMSMSLVNKYATVRGAFDDFRKMTETKEFYENFPEYNVLGFDEHLPKGADERFDLYFVSKDSREISRREEITKRFRQKEKEAEAEIIAAAQRKAKAENKAR